jgi:putative flavoprotein involved in K+ transport
VNVEGALDERGQLLQRRGITPVPGLVTIGRSWQYTTGSALLGFVQHDAAWLVEHLTHHGRPAERG